MEEAVYLPNRQIVVEASTKLTKSVRNEWIGMGRTAAWIDTETAFGNAIREAAARGVSIKVVVFLEKETPQYAQHWLDIGAKVSIFEHGFIRLLIFDRQDAIIVLPRVVIDLDVDRDYFGWHVHGERAVTDLRSYYSQIETAGSTLPTDARTGKEGEVRLREAFKQIFKKYIQWIVTRAPDWLEP